MSFFSELDAARQASGGLSSQAVQDPRYFQYLHGDDEPALWLDPSATSQLVEDDDDPRCAVCGIYRSEHTLLGPPEGCYSFSTTRSFVYTSSDLAEMSWDEQAELFGWDDRAFDPDDEDDDVASYREDEEDYYYDGDEYEQD